MKFLFSGTGSIGSRHIRNLKSLGHRDIIAYEPSAERRRDIEKSLRIELFDSLDKALKKGPDVAFVTSPSLYHLRQAIAAAKADCDIFVEKPLACNLEGLKELKDILVKKRLVFMMGSNWKFHPSFILMKRFIENKEIGRILAMKAHFGYYLPYWHPHENYSAGYSASKCLGGGVIFDSHELDMAMWLLEDSIDRISCNAAKISGLKITSKDYADIAAVFKKGTVFNLHLNYIQRDYERFFEFYGTKGTMRWDFNKKSLVLLRPTQAGKIKIREFREKKGYDINQMYLDELKHFLSCVKKKKKTETGIDTAIRVTLALTAAGSSSARGRTVKVVDKI